MKITLNIPTPLMTEAEVVARRDGTTVRALIERGLRLALAERRERTRFQLRDESVRGSGLQAGAQDMTWRQVLDVCHDRSCT
jgi:hypothetical protein